MAHEFSAEFFKAFMDSIQPMCQKHLHFNKCVEVSGYVLLEMDNKRKERYVLSELVQRNGHSVSESYCTKNIQIPQCSPSSSDEIDVTLNQESKNTEYQDMGRDFSDISKDWTSKRHGGHALTSASISPDILESHRVAESQFSVKSSESNLNSDDLEGTYFRTSPETFFPHTDSGTDMDMTFSEPAQSEDTSTYFGRQMSSDSDIIDLDMIEDEDEEQPEDFDQQASSYSSTRWHQTKTKLSPGTLAVVKNSVKQFRKFHKERTGLQADPASIPPEKLNSLLLEYFRDARRNDGQVLTARTLKNTQIHLDMYLKDAGYTYSISKDYQFQACRDYLKKHLDPAKRAPGQKHSPVTDEDMEVLFQSGQLGCQSLESLLNTLWFLNSRYFAIRRPAEHLNMKWGDILLKVDKNGREYLERPINESFSLKVFAKPELPERCFVQCYKQYQNLRPKMVLDDGSPFYLKHDRNQSLLQESMSYSALGCIWRKIIVSAGLPLDKKIF